MESRALLCPITLSFRSFQFSKHFPVCWLYDRERVTKNTLKQTFFENLEDPPLIPALCTPNLFPNRCHNYIFYLHSPWCSPYVFNFSQLHRTFIYLLSFRFLEGSDRGVSCLSGHSFSHLASLLSFLRAACFRALGFLQPYIHRTC